MDNKTTTSIASLQDAYGGFLIRNGRTGSTCAKYGEALTEFGVWLDGRAPGSLTPGDIDGFLGGWWTAFERRNGREPANATYRAQITAVKGFFSYLERTGALLDEGGQPALNPLRLVEMPKREFKPIDWLNQAEDTALLSLTGTANEEILIWLLRMTGLRVGEARNLKVGDIDLGWNSQCLRVRVSKTQAGMRTIPLAPELVPRIESWFSHLSKNGLYHPQAPLLATRRGTPMASTYIWRAVNRAASKAGVRPTPCTCGSGRSQWHDRTCPRTVSGEHMSEVSPHTLRRTFGSYLLNRDVPIESVSALLGHTSVAITQQYYAELEDKKVRRDFLAAVGGLLRLKRSPVRKRD